MMHDIVTDAAHQRSPDRPEASTCGNYDVSILVGCSSHDGMSWITIHLHNGSFDLNKYKRILNRATSDYVQEEIK